MKIAYVHPDAEGREQEIQQGLYPKNQLWGADLLRDAGHEVITIPTKTSSSPIRFGNWLNKLTRSQFSDFHIEFQVLFLARDVDLVYAPSGHFLLLPLLRRLGLFHPKLVTWFFRLPDSKAWWNPRNLRFSQYILNGFDGLLCLTKRAAKAFRDRTNSIPVKFIPWYADPNIFKREENVDGDEEYFLAVGKTMRDYPTLLAACAKIDAKFRIIAPKELAREEPVPNNVEFVETSSDPPDAAVSYPELRNWYARAKAVLIPLTGDPEDTSGYTSLLEAIQMGKPVIMTQSGCLDVNVETLGIGKLLQPRNVEDWVNTLRDFKKEMGGNHLDRANAQSLFSPRCFGHLLQNFLKSV